MSRAGQSAAVGVRAAGGGEPSGAARPVLELDLRRDAPPDRAAIERLCEQGLAVARLAGGALDLPGRAADDARSFLGWIACIRDLTASAVPVEWRAGAGLARLAPALRHIAPPASGGDAAFEQWRRHHRYGICFWRSGPGFATIIDRRDEESAHHYVLDTADYVDVFARAETVAPRAELASAAAEALEALEADDLILSLGGWSLALPFRMRHWPVPFTAI